jgi:hypothetical protein
MIEWGDASSECLSRQLRPLFVSIKFERMELWVLNWNRRAGGEEDETWSRKTRLLKTTLRASAEGAKANIT